MCFLFKLRDIHVSFPPYEGYYRILRGKEPPHLATCRL